MWEPATVEWLTGRASSFQTKTVQKPENSIQSKNDKNDASPSLGIQPF